MAESEVQEGETIIAECNECHYIFAFSYVPGAEFPECPQCDEATR